jgi:hypothetical protein
MRQLESAKNAITAKTARPAAAQANFDLHEFFFLILGIFMAIILTWRQKRTINIYYTKINPYENEKIVSSCLEGGDFYRGAEHGRFSGRSPVLQINIPIKKRPA